MQTQQTQSTAISARIHPDLKEGFALLPNLNITKENLGDVRSQLEELMSTIPKVRSAYDEITISTQHILGPKDSPDVLVKIYNSNKDIQRPGLLFIHGGSYILGRAYHHDAACQRLAHETDSVVVNVDYRLAPEHPYPAPPEDCYSALVWMKDSAQELGINTKKIAVVGQSAGGGLCAALTMLTRDRGGPEICFQAPLYPMIDNRNVTSSSYEIEDQRCWTRKANIDAWEMYLGEHAKGEISPYAVPARVTDLSRLPPTFIFVGALDIFRDETLEYVTKLLQAKVPVEFHVYPGCFHGFDLYFTEAGVVKVAYAAMINALKQAFSA